MTLALQTMPKVFIKFIQKKRTEYQERKASRVTEEQMATLKRMFNVERMYLNLYYIEHFFVFA
jgi:hypothetical protein